MEKKTKIFAENDNQDILIVREFDLPLESLFTAFTDPELFEQWMGTVVTKFNMQRLGSYQFVTTDPMGNEHWFSGTIHEFELNHKITRTFEMENTPFPVQLEFLKFESTTAESSKLSMHIVYKSIEDRDNMLKLPFEYGINMAHNRLQQIMNKN